MGLCWEMYHNNSWQSDTISVDAPPSIEEALETDLLQVQRAYRHDPEAADTEPRVQGCHDGVDTQGTQHTAEGVDTTDRGSHAANSAGHTSETCAIRAHCAASRELSLQ